MFIATCVGGLCILAGFFVLSLLLDSVNSKFIPGDYYPYVNKSTNKVDGKELLNILLEDPVDTVVSGPATPVENDTINEN